MFTMRSEKLPELISGLQILSRANFGYQELAMDMSLNFPRPEFYNKMFEKWGLETGATWRKQEGKPTIREAKE